MPENAKALPLITEVGHEEKSGFACAMAETAEPAAQKAPHYISRKQLINKLNHINFDNGSICIVFHHTKYARTLTIEARPLPCKDEQLTCEWAEPVDVALLMGSYKFIHILVTKGQQVLEVIPDLQGFDEKQIRFCLPQTCRQVNERHHLLHACQDVEGFIFQNGAFFHGRLVDYEAFQLHMLLETAAPQSFQWLNIKESVILVLTKASATLFSGECRIVRQSQGEQQRHFYLETMKRQVHRFGPKEFRSTRQKLTPPPDAQVRHPLFEKTFLFKISDISGSGIAVEEEEHSAVLIPGLMLPQMKISFGDGSSIHCLAQVIYSQRRGESRTGPIRKCGLVFLDMPVEEHKKLLGLLHQASDEHAYVCNQVDMESLWDFFFETGFIYPQKYEFIQANKEAIKTTCEKLYNRCPSIASHFIYQEHGRILAHLGMIRFYETAWMIQHHAAIRSAYNRGGLFVLNQAGRFINDSHRLHSMKMKYVFCYYRPDNKFPSQVFGGVARNIGDRRICSVDPFGYFHHRSDHELPDSLPAGWSVAPAQERDLETLSLFYQNTSDGLMLEGLHLTPHAADCDELTESYRCIGLKRDRRLYALYHRQALCAVLMVNIADLGLNMSDLTNSISMFVINGQPLTREVVHAAIVATRPAEGHSEMPVLMYPRETADRIGLSIEKTYCLWVLNFNNPDAYFRYLKRLLKFVHY